MFITTEEKELALLRKRMKSIKANINRFKHPSLEPPYEHTDELDDVRFTLDFLRLLIKLYRVRKETLFP